MRGRTWWNRLLMGVTIGTWDDWVFRGTPYKCPADGKECKYTWGESKTTTSGWVIGGGTDLGNTSSPTSKWYNFVIPLVVGYQKTTVITTDFTWTVTFSPGQEATPVQIAVRRWTQGDFSGGWVRTNRGCQGGTTYQWDGNIRFGSWDRNVFEKARAGYATDGRI